MQLINLTPHDINVIQEDHTYTIKASGNVARCTVNAEYFDYIEPEDDANSYPISIYTNSFTNVTDLPEPQDGVYYIVSNIVAQAMRYERVDLLIPNELVRDEEGRIIGCKSFAIIR